MPGPEGDEVFEGPRQAQAACGGASGTGSQSVDEGDAVLAPQLRHPLGRACRIARKRPIFSDATLNRYAARFEAELDALFALAPTHAAGRKFQAAVEKFRRHLFVVMTNRAIPPTNNGSERALRPCFTFRKITNGFRSQWAAFQYAHIRSVIETARRHAVGPLQAIRQPMLDQPDPIAA